ncbi:hydantoinase B/oxoprolinase family protein [Cyanobium sp. NIES-981]|uniref:hydantoinase B/oxoprolinase family protein n=1 Tax=Cyanobium sp. NIES-981 TaxID=1851505 RepID=UPI0007DDED75|nr:hydantoinase B/oxoprolinase family protein [Cyanobium sp. NIES-981]SBO41743.1 Hydantoinase/oxoprolinase domain family protein [Cyanobium sp. NIES-981]
MTTRARSPQGWRFWIDRGGTFTDVIGLAPSGRIQVRKVLSVQPDRPGDPAARAIRAMAAGDPIAELRLGTTVATNALLEQRGAGVVLLINRGLGDLLRIGDQHRPDIFALAIHRPQPLRVRVLEVGGRLDAEGRELTPLRLDAPLAARVRQARAEGYGSCAVALLHSHRQPAHERQLAAWLAGFGFEAVALSHRLSAQPRLVPRGHTALVEAAVAPVLRAYLQQVEAALGSATRLRVLGSSGALVAPAFLHAKDTILSGPAGGMVGAVAVAQEALGAAGHPPIPVVGFDMGGTSTDVFHWDPGRGALAWERQPETEIAGLRLRAPMLPIHTVAAGGGSILRFDGQRLIVGPESAGADPGPAAYRRGGPATITDANLLLGRLPAAALPPVFGPGADQPADLEAVQQRFAELAAAMAPSSPGITPEQVAAGALRIAIETMAAAIRRISIERGHDLRQALLVSYGGAGGQHACRLARCLGIRQVLLHPLAGVLSAYGIGRAEQRSLQECAPDLPLIPSSLPRLERLAAELRRQGGAELHAAGDLEGAQQEVRSWCSLELCLPGREDGLLVPWTPGQAAEALHEAFLAEHRERFGHAPELGSGELVVGRLLLEVAPPEPPEPPGSAPAPAAEQVAAERAGVALVRVWLDERRGWQPVPLWRREQLQPGQRLEGPALLLDPTSTSLLEQGWRGRVLPDQAVLLEATAVATTDGGPGSIGGQAGSVDPTLLELYNHRFSAIAEQMGVRLQQSARSVNIRERLDFSCAVFDGAGALVANAPHIPVHLGSMGESVASLMKAVARGERPPLAPGDVVLANDPFGGGTHLPDITAITPVFVPGADSAAPAFFVASRGHHADVGGITPGSMPAFSRRIEEEGLLLDNQLFLHQGQLDEPAWRARFARGPHPVRNPDQLLADLQAQVAANRLGVAELQRLIDTAGLAEVRAYMGHVQANAAEAVRRVVARLQDGSARVSLDDGSCIAVQVRINRRRRVACLDFSGTSPQHPGNLNAPLAITRAVVLYVFRCLVGEAIPLNAGCFEPLELVVPPGSLLHPQPPAAVVAGNVETSQALANALFAALGVQAAAQGTMNNLSFGDGRVQYYETICGGTGGGRDLEGQGFAGASAVQSHMTNSRLTDPEVLEERLPVRLETFRIRRGSGGAGRWPGGDGVVRRLRFLAPMTVSLLSGSRRVPPFGLAGGEPGQPGRNRLEHADGRVEHLPGSTEVQVEAGDGLLIETPGGGGYGPAQPSPQAMPL